MTADEGAGIRGIGEGGCRGRRPYFSSGVRHLRPLLPADTANSGGATQHYLVKTYVLDYIMTKPKDKLNWFYVLLGLFMLAGYFYPKNTPIDDFDLKTKAITLSRDVEYIKGRRRSDSYHRLWTNETKAAFIIDVPGGMAAKWRPLDSLKHGDSLTIKYESIRDIDVGNGVKEIPIYFLQKADKLYFDTGAYNQSKIVYDKRWGWIFLIGGALLILRGLTVISSKTSYILGGLAFAVIVVLRLLNKF
jgi:hypothetical protein